MVDLKNISLDIKESLGEPRTSEEYAAVMNSLKVTAECEPLSRTIINNVRENVFSTSHIK